MSVDGIDDVAFRAAQTSTALFEAANSFAAGGTELQAIATEASLLHSLTRRLVKQAAFSTSAVDAVHQILRRCRQIYLAVDHDLHALASLIDPIARLRWALDRKAHFLVLGTTLECCRILCRVMLATLDIKGGYADREPTDSAPETKEEPDAAVTSLLAALLDAVQRLEIIENDEDAWIGRDESTKDATEPGGTNPTTSESLPALPVVSASLWMRSLLPFALDDRCESESDHLLSNTKKLVAAWTIPPARPSKATLPPNLVRAPGVGQILKPVTTAETVESTSSGNLPKEIFRGGPARQEKTGSVLASALKRYKIDGDWRDYDLSVVLEGQSRILGPDEEPLALFLELSRAGRWPQFKVTRRDKAISGDGK